MNEPTMKNQVIELLGKLTPAETMAFGFPEAPDRKQLLVLTLRDLLRRGLLRFAVKEASMDKDLPSYMEKGPNYDGLTGLMHEDVFLKPYQYVSDEMSLSLRDLAMVASKDFTHTARAMLLLVRDSKALEPFVRRSFWHKIAGTYGLTDEGVLLREQLRAYIHDLKKRLHFSKKNRPAILEECKAIGGNILLLEDDKSLWKKEFEHYLKEQGNSNKVVDIYDDPFDWLYLFDDSDFAQHHFADFSEISSEFDGGYVDMGDNSGCSSGCSGCSGCGGCGD